jgi:hypothetical protein
MTCAFAERTRRCGGRSRCPSTARSSRRSFQPRFADESGLDVTGEGGLESAFDHCAPATRGTVPERRRTDRNPPKKRKYLVNLTHRVGS